LNNFCSGGYFSAAGDDPSILMRAKEDYDGAEPAASSIAAANLFKLAALVSGEAGQRYGRIHSAWKGHIIIVL